MGDLQKSLRGDDDGEDCLSAKGGAETRCRIGLKVRERRRGEDEEDDFDRGSEVGDLPFQRRGD